MCDDLLTAYERLHDAGPEFGGDEEGDHGLTNHGPMAAEVVVRRGLDLRLDRWLDRYVERLTPLPSPGQPITDWRAALGDPRRLADWTAFFRAEVRSRPWREVLASWWPRLLPGIAAGSTHGVIRVGHAVRALRVRSGPLVLDELANGLAFWAARSRVLPGGRGVGALSPAAALSALPTLPSRSGLIAHRLTRLAALPQWPAAVGSLSVPADPDDVPEVLGALVDAATVRYLSVGRSSPVLLVHTATAPNAVLHCLPVLPKDLWRRSLAAAWAAAAAVTVTYAGPPTRSSALPRGDDPVGVLLDRAADHQDEHVIKFADTAVESFARTGDHDALAAAHLAADLVK
ncbi:questin oxidase family protein [Actinophytocola oryzae]|uniref:questin oxidase family protein n=1 Tax=Actinophytocola oryzae TaxID=502181 RepID=UPI001AAE6C8A|nr:questin oxidase family protein [Actinophytocola oryzae]